MKIDGAVNAQERLIEGNTAFSICTLVTTEDEYQEMMASFVAKGFGHDDCEYLYVDNTNGNSLDGYAGYNLFLNVAKGHYIILCHQDILLDFDSRADLEDRLRTLTETHPKWALCGNSGVRPDGTFAIRITDPLGADTHLGPLPAKVCALDEDFIVVRRDANLALSSDIEGFHLYCTDLCINAKALGYEAFVIDFHLRHKSPGGMSEAFKEVQRQLVSKYNKAWRPRWISTNCTIFFVSGWAWLTKLGNARFVIRQILNGQKKRRLRAEKSSRG